MTPNYTTDYMQSLELLQAGLDRETADFYFTEHSTVTVWPLGETSFSDKCDASVPSWSMPRLWDILNKAGRYFFEYSTNDTVEHVMESLVYAVERAARKGFLKNEKGK